MARFPSSKIMKKQFGKNYNSPSPSPLPPGERDFIKARLKVLFLCTGNSCRSQMAEGWTRHLKGDRIEPYSAGLQAKGLNARAVQVMAESGVDISMQTSQEVAEVMHIDFDYVVTVCGHAHEHCPMFPGKTQVVHVGFDDPPKLAESAKSEEEALGHFRRVRDEIHSFVDKLPHALTISATEMD